MKNGRVVFVGGCSGTGKTTIATRISEKHHTVHYVSASGLLTEGDRATTSLERSLATNAAHVEETQTLIVERFTRIRGKSDGIILLDGHFVVPMTTGFHAIAPDIFASLGSDILVLIENSPEVIASRLRLRADARWWDGSLPAIRTAMRMEREHATYVGSILGLALIVIDAQSSDAEGALLRAVIPPL